MNELKLDIGCGGRGSRQAGFIGIDLCPRPEGKSEEEYFRLDFVRDELPWESETVDEAIALHVIEHLTREDGKLLVQRAVQLLKLGSTLTITCPDLKKICQAYVQSDHEFLQLKHLRGGKEVWPGRTAADRVNWAIHQDGHKWSYDLHSLSMMAKEAVDELDGPAVTIEPFEEGGKWNTRPGVECGIVITRRAKG